MRDVFLEPPFLVVGSMQRVDGSIKVFQLAADKLMEDLNTVPPLIKTIKLFSTYISLSWNGLFFGCHQKYEYEYDHEHFVTLFEKKALLNAATPPEQTDEHSIDLGDKNFSLVDMNTTSLVYIEKVPVRMNPDPTWLRKKDFWGSGILPNFSKLLKK